MSGPQTYNVLLYGKTELFFVCEDQCTLHVITSHASSTTDKTQVIEVNSLEEEAGTQICLHLPYINSHYPNRSVTVRSTSIMEAAIV